MDAIVLQVSQQIKTYFHQGVKYKIAQRFCMVIFKKLNYSSIFIAIMFSCSRQCVSKWYHRFQRDGFVGLEDLRRSGRPKKLSNDSKSILESSILKISEEDKNLLCQSNDLIFRRFFSHINTIVSKSTICRFIANLGFKKLSPRPIHEKNDPKKMSQWKSALPRKIQEVKELHKEKEVVVYFQDESRYGQKTGKYKILAKKGSSPTYKNQNGFLNSWIYGAIEPKSGKKFGLILPKLDSINMQIFLNKFSKTIHHKKHALLILDGSSAHKNGTLKVPKNITLHFLPPYSPELNPIERLWLFIKKNYLAFKIYDNIDKLIQVGADAWRKINSKIVQSVCQCGYLADSC